MSDSRFLKENTELKMFIEACLISVGLHAGAEAYKKLKKSKLYKKLNEHKELSVPKQKNELMTADTYPKIPQEKIKRMTDVSLISLGFATGGLFFSAFVTCEYSGNHICLLAPSFKNMAIASTGKSNGGYSGIRDSDRMYCLRLYFSCKFGNRYFHNF